MNNSLRRLEKNLRSYAKRCKDVKYTSGLLLTFLLTGMLSLSTTSVTNRSIEQQRQSINNSISDMKQSFRRAKSENNKLLKNANLELIQLMEQGDQVVKSYWSSWQFGVNYYYNSWNGVYKGRGDKAEKYPYEGLFTRSSDLFVRTAIVGEDTYDSLISDGDITSATTRYRELRSKLSSTTGLPVFSYGLASTKAEYTEPLKIEINASVNPKIITKIAPTVNISPTAPNVILPVTISLGTPSAPGGFTPTIIQLPTQPGAPQVTIPEDFTPPKITFIGSGFGQGQAISMPRSNIIIQNYNTYNTDSLVRITTGASGTTWSGGTITAVTSPNGTNYNVTPGAYQLTPGSTSSLLNAFINDLRDRNAIIDGDYAMTDLGGGNTTKIFLSHNPAGVGNPGYDGLNTAGERKTEFRGTLELNGITVPNNSNVLVGVEHQLWNNGAHASSYSVFENKGTILLASGNNIIGIMIDDESNTQPGNLPHKTLNTGKIIINSKNSIGIDFGRYNNNNLKVEVSIGNIEVNGESNYGLRMDNVNSNDYYDKGLKITSGLDSSGAPTKITVGGKNNVGVSITKFLSSVANSNPIANISNLNIEVTGENVVGFLRNEEYSSNNVNDMLLNASTMGTFSFGTSAKNSVLIRSDKYGIKIEKDISSTQGSTGNIFAQATKSGKIINVAKLYSTLSNFTGLLSSGTSTASVENSGTIEIIGSGNNNVGIGVLGNTTGTNSGIIKVLGSGNNKAGIYNEGTFTISNGSNIEVSGSTSTVAYNEGNMNIAGTVTLKGTNGTTGIYSDGGTVTSTSGNSLFINLDDSASLTSKGVGTYIKGGANVDIKGAQITVKEGSGGVVSTGAGSKIDLSGGRIDYSGEGYAAYSDGVGTINLTNANIFLSGKAIGTEIDLTPGASSPVNLNGATITMMSNDATVVNLKNANGLLSSTLNGIGGSLGITIIDGSSSSGTTYDQYKIATADGGDMTINSDMNKYATADTGGTTPADDDGYFYSRRFLGQRLDLTVGTGVTVTSSTDTTYATTYFNNQISGLEMNSSSLATSNTEAQINLLANSTVIADRTNAGSGATGLFINYGTVKTDTTSKILVETLGNTVNDKGIGIFAVNGSVVNNEGTVEVAGNDAFGLLGMTYRVDPTSGVKTNEFGGKTGEGTITLNNKGTIDLSSGTNNVGIYGINNNNVPGSLNSSNVIINNSGTIKVGDKSVTAAPVGIYTNSGNVTNSGDIEVGKEGAGIYTESGNVTVTGGTITIGEGSTALSMNLSPTGLTNYTYS